MAIAPQLKELLLQALEHERGGVVLYQTALECVLNDGLRREWEKYLGQTRNHVDVLVTACVALGVDPHEMTPGRRIVHHNGKALAVAMKMALANGNSEAAELVACDCIVLAETKDHANWELLAKSVETLDEDEAAALQAAVDAVEDEEDEHLYHTKGWCRELWLKSLGLDAQLPPREERDRVKDAVSAARVESERGA